jgi:hypothetical protein
LSLKQDLLPKEAKSGRADDYCPDGLDLEFDALIWQQQCNSRQALKMLRWARTTALEVHKLNQSSASRRRYDNLSTVWTAIIVDPVDLQGIYASVVSVLRKLNPSYIVFCEITVSVEFVTVTAK